MEKNTLKESVSAVLIFENQVFMTKRPDHLKVFPGYYATPGGKIDANDLVGDLLPEQFRVAEDSIVRACLRELKEELSFDVLDFFHQKKIKSISFFGEAITPEFNPYRFRNTYLRIDLLEKPQFQYDPEEVAEGIWGSAHEFLNLFNKGEMLAVPVAIKILDSLKDQKDFLGPIDFESFMPKMNETPKIESLKGVLQLLPLSNTFPPANRTNSFLIGDQEATKLLIDPSPKESDLEKYLKTLATLSFDMIFLTHHHPDHYEFADFIARKFNVPIGMSAITKKRIEKKKGDGFFNGIEIRLYKEGDVITKSLGSSVRVYEVPGHDDGQLALAPDSLNWFLVGDLIQTIGTVVIGDDEGNMSDYFKSLERVIALSPKYIIPSHGIIIGGTYKLSQTLEHRKMRENEILNLANNGKNFDEILAIVYQGLESRLLPYAKKTILAHLNKLHEEKKLDKHKLI